MDVFMMIQRKKLTIFTDAKDNILVRDLKKMIACIIRVSPLKMQLYYDDKIMNNNLTLLDCGLNSNNAKAHVPAPIGLALKMENGEFEQLEIISFSMPPELPNAMRNQEENDDGLPM